MFHAYVLVSLTTGRRYIDHTDDLSRRVVEHNSRDHNRRKYTSRQQGPWTLVYSEPHSCRAEAMRRERWLKSGIGRQWLDQQLMLGSPSESSVARASPPLAD